MFLSSNTNYAGVLLGLALACIVWFASLAGLFLVPNGVLYDRLSALSAPLVTHQPRVLVVEVAPALLNADDATWNTLQQHLLEQGATRIAFAFMPPQASPAFYAAAHKTGKVTFARALTGPADGSGATPKLEAAPLAAAGLGFKPIAYALAPSEYGVYRRQARQFGIGDEAILSIQAALAGIEGAETRDQLPLFSVNFLGAKANLPHIPAQSILRGDLISELVTGRTVLVGLAGTGAGLHTPLFGAAGPLSELAFHGYALDTLLSGSAISTLARGLEILLILTVCAVSLILLQWGGMRMSTLLTTLLFGVSGAVAWLVLSGLRVWLPLAEMWLVQLAALLLFMRIRAVGEENQLRDLANNASAKLRYRLFAVDSASADERWSQVITMVNQTLNLDRVIFLERLKGDHRVREVISLNCGLEDLKELRRDYERTPYSTAITEAGPIQVHRYLTTGQENEVQYLVPLMFYGDVLGFWAFAAQPEKLATLHNLNAVLTSFAGQIAELLFHYQQRGEREGKLRPPLQRYLRLQGGERLIDPLKKAMATLDRKLSGVENYLNGLHSASILYDLFGSVLIANKKMVDLLTDAELKPYQMTAIDLISAVTGADLDHARALMRSIILERRSVSLPTRLGTEKHRYVLQLAPLLPAREAQELGERGPQPFEVEGVLCELIDLNAFEQRDDIKKELVARFAQQVKHDSVALHLGLAMFEQTGLTDTQHQRVLAIVKDKINALIERSDRTHAILHQQAGMGFAVDHYPIDSKQPLLSALEHVHDKAAARRVTFALDLPDLIGLAFASSVQLHDVISDLLILLINDTPELGNISVSLCEQEDMIVYRFSSEGFGMPSERFQACLRDTQAPIKGEYQALRVGARTASLWGGVLEGDSALGRGTNLELRLRGFF